MRIDSNLLQVIFDFMIVKKIDYYAFELLKTSKTEIFFTIKHSLFFKLEILVDMFICDFVYYIKRFKVCYNFCSIFFINSLYLFLSLKILDSWVSSWNVFKSCIWMEREVYDMFGIKFINNWDLRKILTDYTFFGFPLRKDFPLSGYSEHYYDIKRKSIFEMLIELMQEFRFFIVSALVEFWDLNKL